jgi:hypothetical protein
VTTPFATSNAFVTNDDLETIYVAVVAFTMMMPIRYNQNLFAIGITGSFGPPSCVPSPKSPSQAFNVGE